METYVYLIIILIIILFSYIIYKNINDYYTLEKFTLIDNDSYMNNINSFSKANQLNFQQNILQNSQWNKVWRDTDNTINVQTLQMNDKIIIAIGNINVLSLTTTQLTGEDSCLNMFLGIGQLNKEKNSFYIKDIICNKYINNAFLLNGNPTSQIPDNISSKFTGLLNNNELILKSSLGTTTITLNLFKENNNLYEMSDLIKKISPYFTEQLESEDTNYEYSSLSCPFGGTYSCKINDKGIKSSDGKNNACCSIVYPNDPTCYYDLPSSYSGTLPKCGYTLNQYINYKPNLYSMTSTNSTLNMCNILSNFSSSQCNSALLCYVKNIGDVQTLNYQFFGTMPNESSLVTQYDKMYNILNNSGKNLSRYRNDLTTFDRSASFTQNIEYKWDAISFTNCMNNSNQTNMTDLTRECINTCVNYTQNFSNNSPNSILEPTVWQINYGKTSNMVNSCGFTLSTSVIYNTQVKYVNYDNQGNINMSIYNGGLNSYLYFDDARVIKQNSSSSPMIAITANIKTNNGLFLIPDNSYGGFSNNSNMVRLNDSVEDNGKWLIIGFVLNSLNSLDNTLNNINIY